jgi:polynucleotide 5'-kinase involved in rRNA processing
MSMSERKPRKMIVVEKFKLRLKMELTVRQQTIFDTIVKMYHSVPFGSFIVYGAKKSGKSYLYRALKEHFLNKSNKICVFGG